MNTTMASLVGVGVCCVVPLLSFAAGIVYARFGVPVSIRWRGFAEKGSDDDEERTP